MMNEPRTIHDLDTPALLVDAGRLERNIAQIQKVADAAGVALRPHIKTHKCLEIARRQLKAGARGLTCQKISEAHVMSAVCDDLFISYPIIGPIKLQRLDRLAETHRVRIGVESAVGAKELSDHLQRAGRDQEVMIKLEVGVKRTGVEIEELESFIESLAGLAHIRPVGIFTHEGMAYGLQGDEAMRQLLDDVARKLKTAGEIFERIIGAKPILSPGCTMTAPFVEAKHGFDEMRPGAYALKDTFCVMTRVYAEEECALTVLVQIVAVKPDGRVIVDGGSKTFFSDAHAELKHGIIPGHPDLRFVRVTEEHGFLQTDHPERHKIGDRLEIIPAHVCPVVNLHSRLMVRENENIIDAWTIDARGCVT